MKHLGNTYLEVLNFGIKMFRNPTEAKQAIEAGGAQADIGDIEKDMNQVSLGKSMEGGGVDKITLAKTELLYLKNAV